MKIISNTSPLIAFSRIKQLLLLKNIFKEIIIPEAVLNELFGSKRKVSIEIENWIKIRKVKDLKLYPLLKELGDGEKEALILAKELNADFLLIDERPATKIAKNLEIPTIGTLGIMIIAKRLKYISSVKEMLESLIKEGFYISDDIYKEVLNKVKEF